MDYFFTHVLSVLNLGQAVYHAFLASEMKLIPNYTFERNHALKHHYKNQMNEDYRGDLKASESPNCQMTVPVCELKFRAVL